MTSITTPLKRIESTDHEKARAFEWLREEALDDANPFARCAMILMQEIHDLKGPIGVLDAPFRLPLSLYSGDGKVEDADGKPVPQGVLIRYVNKHQSADVRTHSAAWMLDELIQRAKLCEELNGGAWAIMVSWLEGHRPLTETPQSATAPTREEADAAVGRIFRARNPSAVMMELLSARSASVPSVNTLEECAKQAVSYTFDNMARAVSKGSSRYSDAFLEAAICSNIHDAIAGAVDQASLRTPDRTAMADPSPSGDSSDE